MFSLKGKGVMEPFLILDTIGEGEDFTSFDVQRQRDLADVLGLPFTLVRERWCRIDLTLTTLAYAPGERYIPPEEVYQDQLENVERILQKRCECLAGMPTMLIFDEDVEGCHAINVGFAVAVCLQTSIPPRLIGVQQNGTSGRWLMTTNISFSPEYVTPWSQAVLVPIPMGTGEDMLLSEVLSTYLLWQKRRIADTSVGPMAVGLLVSLERYRRSRDLDAFARDLGIPSEVIAVYRSTHERH